MNAVGASSVAMNVVAASSVAMNAVAASSVAIGAIASSTTAKNAVLASQTALDALDRSPLAQTMSSAGTVNGRGFVISYSVQSNYYRHNNEATNPTFCCRGGYDVIIDKSVSSCSAANDTYTDKSTNASGNHMFFTSRISLVFTTGTSSSTVQSATGSGNMKYILCS